MIFIIAGWKVAVSIGGCGAAVVWTGTLGGAVVLRSGLADCVVIPPTRSATV